jgi:hypothetical protein
MSRRWVDAQPAEALYLSSVTLGELAIGVSMLPKGKRRQGLTPQVRHIHTFATGLPGGPGVAGIANSPDR